MLIFYCVTISNVHLGCRKTLFWQKIEVSRLPISKMEHLRPKRDTRKRKHGGGFGSACIDFQVLSHLSFCFCSRLSNNCHRVSAPAWLPSNEVGCPCKCNGILPPACVLPCASSFSLCLPSWKSSVCRKQVTVTVANLPQTSTFEGGMRYIFGHTPYQPLETYQDEQRKYQNYDTYTGGVVQFNLQRKTEVETYPGGIVEFDSMIIQTLGTLCK